METWLLNFISGEKAERLLKRGNHPFVELRDVAEDGFVIRK
jgi:hypothetical protein